MSVLTSKLILELIDRLTGPAKKANAALTSLKAAQARNSAMLATTSQKLVVAGAAAYGLARGIGAPIKAAMAFESAMADVRKVVDFEQPDGLKKMSADIIEMSKRIPIAATGLAQIAAAAGSAGMRESEIAAFTEMTARLATAFDMTAGDAGEAMAKVKTALGLTVEETSALADAFNHLSNNMAAKAPQILDYMKRVGVSGRQYGFSAEQTAALGAAMIAAGAESEVAATSFRNIGKALSKADNVSKDTEAAFKKLGLTSMAVTKAMQKNAVGTFKAVLKRVAKLPKYLQKSVLTQIFGEEARGMDPLVDNVKLLDDSLGMVATKTNYLGSATKEFKARTETTANAVQLFKNRLEALSIAIGVALLPGVRDATTAMNPLIERLTKWAESNPAIVRAVTLTTAGLIGLRIAALGLKFAFGWLWGGALWVARGALVALGAASAPLTIILGTLGAAAIYAYNNWNEILQLWQRLKEPWLNLGTTISATWEKIAAPMRTKLAEIVTAVRELPEKVKAAASGMYDAGVALITQLWEGMKAKVHALLGWVSGIGSRIKSAIGLGGAAPSGSPAVAGSRATGGPVQRGKSYLVGERGPELWQAPGSGRILDTMDTVRAIKSAALAGAARHAAGGANISAPITISIQAAPGQSPEAIAAAVERRLSDKLNQLSRGAYSDGSYT